MNIEELSKFLVKAKTSTYASDVAEITSQRKGFKELEFEEGDWCYRDSYSGFYCAPGQEVVSFRGEPVWAMSYNGGMRKKYHENLGFAKQTFNFLKEALKRIEESRPFRGPESFEQGDYEYVDESEGDVTSFKGLEKIFYKGELVFEQDYIGGLIIQKNFIQE
ncbi:MAG: hypothetical protein GOU97_00750 [Nanoarchaeota archaeon]|nr:hypothetical protein [Nanoarchaeota archaeon]